VLFIIGCYFLRKRAIKKYKYSATYIRDSSSSNFTFFVWLICYLGSVYCNLVGDEHCNVLSICSSEGGFY
jgi:hypothetical protein